MTKQGLKHFATLIGILLIAYTGIALASESIPLFGRFHHFVIASDSMEPVLEVNDVVIIDENQDFETGDIIAFETTIDGQEIPVVHYLDEIEQTDEGTQFHTRSEAGGRDAWTLEESDIIGVQRARIPGIGVVFNFLASAIGRVVLVVNLIGIYAIYRIFKSTRKNA